MPATPTRCAAERLRTLIRAALYFADEHPLAHLEADATLLDGPGTPEQLPALLPGSATPKPTGPLDYHSDRSHHIGLGR